MQVCNTLLDSGYIIEKKDNELQTARTEVREYPYLWNATYYINVRVKDSVAYISSYFWGPDGFSQSSYLTNKAGKPQVKHLYVIPFLLIKRIAESFNKELDYLNSETK